MAKRLAGEEEEQEKPKRDRYPDLAQAEQLVLLAVARENGITVEEVTNRVNEAMPTVGNKPYASPGLVMLLLITLRGKKMVIDRKASGKWIAGLIGREYLTERGLR